MRRNEKLWLVIGAAAFAAALLFSAINGGEPVGGSSELGKFVTAVGREAAELNGEGRELGRIAEVWGLGRK